MSAATLYSRPPNPEKSALSEFPRLSPVTDSDEGYCSWLQWVQELLGAHSLVLYGCQLQNTKLVVEKPLSFPVGKPIDQTIQALAQRCADEARMLRTTRSENSADSIVAIPDNLGKKSNGVSHVLLINRHENTSLDPQVQARLVLWAFSALDRYKAPVQSSTARIDLPQCIVNHMMSSEDGLCAYALLMKELQRRTACESCMIAELKIRANIVRGVSLKAISGQGRIDGRLAEVRALSAAMEEDYLGKSLPLKIHNHNNVGLSLLEPSSVVKATEQCARLSIPVNVQGTWLLVSLERNTNQPFSPTLGQQLQVELAAALHLVTVNERGSLGVFDALKRQSQQWLQTIGVSRRKQALLCSAAVAVLALFLFPVEHRVSASLNVEASERHVLIAPTDGFVESIEVKAGHQVVKGQTLATLDDLDLQLQQQKLQSQSLQNQQSYAKALASHDRIEVTRLKEQSALIDAELAQLSLQREKMKLVAPVDSVVLSATLDDYLGAAITAGDTLFSLGSIDSNRLVLDVSEYDVRHVLTNQEVGIRLSANPSHVLAAKVLSIMPLVVANAGVNTVQVHAKLLENEPLRPGMQGVGKILVGRKALGIQWFERLGSRLIWLGWKLGLIR